jgi:endo-1,4-beta-xylanase
MNAAMLRSSARATLRARSAAVLVLLFGCGPTPPEAVRDGGGKGDDPEAGDAAVDPGDDDDGTLRAAARRAGVLVGAAVALGPLADDEAYRRTLTGEFDAVTPENAMKWDALRPAPGAFDWSGADAIVELAEAEGMAVKGHPLLWHEQVPAWVRALPPAELAAIAEEHVRAVVARYRGRVAAWDVVNEAVADDGGLRATPFLAALGPDYLGKAFRWAHEEDPDATLLYNDYGAEGDGAKADAVFALLEDLVAEGVPVHGVGLQMHVAAGQRPDAAALADNVARLRGLGLDVMISEMDVRVAAVSEDRAERLEAQRAIYRELAGACVAAGCVGVTTWGFTDAHSWVDSFYGPDDPLPFDEAYQRKPAHAGLRAAFLGE